MVILEGRRGLPAKGEFAKGSMTRSEALAALNNMAQSINPNEWSSIDEAEEKLADFFLRQ